MRVIKVDGVNAYFRDLNENKHDKFTSLSEMKGWDFIFNDEELENRIPVNNINVVGGVITFKFNNELIIIDDNYRDTLIKSGYIIKDNYDIIRIDSPEEGKKIRYNIFKDIADALPNSRFISNQQLNVEFESNEYRYTVVFDTVNGIVAKNQLRHEQKLAIYPFEKSMDKFGCIYYSIFAERKFLGNEKKFLMSDKFMDNLIDELNKTGCYKYTTMSVKKKLIYQEGI